RPCVRARGQGTEKPPRARGCGVAPDHELLPQLTFDLEPVPRALADVRAVALLRDHALQPLLASGREKGSTVLDHVVAVVNDAARRQQELQAFLARLERQPPEIAAVERERVEECSADRHLAPRA